VLSRLASFLVVAGAVTGCSSSSHFPEESRESETAIKSAEKAGASEHSKIMLESARDLHEHAKRAEEAATRDSKEAREQLKAAQKRAERADQGLASAKRKKAQESDAKQGYLLAIDRQKEHADELRKKGVSEDEIQRLNETDTQLTNLRIRSCDAAIAALEKEIELCELEKLDAQLSADAAKARLDTADKRLEVARLLFRASEEEARVAEAESLDEKRIGTRARINQM